MPSSMKLVALLGATAAVTLTATTEPGQNASAQDSVPTQAPTEVVPPSTPPPTYWERHGCRAYVPVRVYRRHLRHAMPFSIRDGDFRAGRYSTGASRKLARLRRCARTARMHRLMLTIHSRRRHVWAWVAQIDAITSYGKWAIPPYIVACESHGSWYAHNPSGASGPYQLLGWGAPYPATTPQTWALNHVIAARVWRTQGAGAWTCA